MKRKEIGTLYATDAPPRDVHPHDGKRFTLAELQGFVGGNIEIVRLLPGHGHAKLYVNEDGRNLELPVNENASAHAAFCPIVGPAISVRSAVVDGRESH